MRQDGEEQMVFAQTQGHPPRCAAPQVQEGERATSDGLRQRGGRSRWMSARHPAVKRARAQFLSRKETLFSQTIKKDKNLWRIIIHIHE